MTEFNANTVLWSLDDYIKVRKDEMSINRKVKQKKDASQGTRQSAHLQSYKDADLSQDEDDDGEFSFPTVEKGVNVDDATHAANMNQLNFEKNDFDQLMYDDRTQTDHVDSIAEPLEAPNLTPPRQSVKSRLGLRPWANGDTRWQQPQLKQHGTTQKRGGACPNNINKRNRKRSNFNQRRTGANVQSGLDLSFEQKMYNANIGQLQNVLNSAPNTYQNNNFAHNGLPFNASANNNNLHFNNNTMMRLNQMNGYNSNSIGALLQNMQGSVNPNICGGLFLNSQGLVNSNSNGVLLQHTQAAATLNNFGGMAQNQGAINSIAFGGGFQNNQTPVNLNSFGGGFQNNQGPVNVNSFGGTLGNMQVTTNSNNHGGLIQNSQGSANSNRYPGLLSNNKGSCSTNSFGEMQGTANSSSYSGRFSSNNVGMFSSNNGAMFSNNATSTRPNIIANNWGSSAEMRSKSPVNVNARQSRQEPSVKGNLEALLASPDQPKSGMFVGEALGMSLSDCKTADFRTVAQNVLFLLATAENDSQTKPDYGVVNKNVSQDRHL